MFDLSKIIEILDIKKRDLREGAGVGGKKESGSSSKLLHLQNLVNGGFILWANPENGAFLNNSDDHKDSF